MRRPWWCGSRRTPRPHTQQRAAPRHLQIFSDKCKYFLQHTVCLHHTDTLTASRTYFGVVGNIDLLQLLFTLHSLDSLLLDVAVRGLPHVIILHEVLDRLPGEEVCPYFIETLTKLVLHDLLRKHNSYSIAVTLPYFSMASSNSPASAVVQSSIWSQDSLGAPFSTSLRLATEKL